MNRREESECVLPAAKAMLPLPGLCRARNRGPALLGPPDVDRGEDEPADTRAARFGMDLWVYL